MTKKWVQRNWKEGRNRKCKEKVKEISERERESKEGVDRDVETKSKKTEKRWVKRLSRKLWEKGRESVESKREGEKSRRKIVEIAIVRSKQKRERAEIE